MRFSWLTNVVPIALLFSFRMLGLFMLIPVFSVLATSLDQATPTLIGVALGSYGLSQGLLQIPFGLLSDKWGRKPLIAAGLLLFITGSLLGALTHSIYGMITARILQGTGAIGSVLIALLADLTPDTRRTQAMAIIGMTIGLSFILAMVLSPVITSYYGLSGIFYLTAVLALAGLMLLFLVIPTPVSETFHQENETKLSLLKSVLRDPALLKINGGIFIQHFILTATFFSVPLLLRQQMLSHHLSQSWHFYLPLMLLSFIAMVPLIRIAERRHAIKPVFISTVLISGLSQFMLALMHANWLLFCLLLFTYFFAFNYLEANLPSLISRQANPNSKGTAMGVYSTCQYLGIFLGGCWAGWAYQQGGHAGIFYGNALLCLVWLSFAKRAAYPK